ncbi:MAG: PIN domain-containing protein, partial [Bdellovibrionales bacterium]|nr:PIN domain-containing protein [Bdellovibrionales bacterium]
MAQYTALFDACVLYPMGLRDLLMELALTDTFRARWTNEILDEWVDAIHERRPDIPKQNLSKQRALMNDHVRDALIENYQDLIPTLSLPDPKDRHVLAAAIRGRADAIVTFNLKD